MVTRSLRRNRPRRKIGGNTRSVISRISSFKPKSLITVGGKRKYKKHRKVSDGSKKSHKKDRGRSKTYKKKGGSKSNKSKRTYRKRH